LALEKLLYPSATAHMPDAAAILQGHETDRAGLVWQLTGRTIDESLTNLTQILILPIVLRVRVRALLDMTTSLFAHYSISIGGCRYQTFGLWLGF
jgi:hypothetical protein